MFGCWQGLLYAEAVANKVCRGEVSPAPAGEWGAGGGPVNPVKVRGWAGSPREAVLSLLTDGSGAVIRAIRESGGWRVGLITSGWI